MAGGRQLRSRRQSHAGQRGNRLWGLPAQLGRRRPAPPRPRGARPPPRPAEPGTWAGPGPLPPSEAWARGKGPSLGQDAQRGPRSAVPGLAAWRQRAALPLARYGRMGRSGAISAVRAEHRSLSVV